MRIKFHQTGGDGRFVALDGDQELGELLFREQSPGLVSAYRTFVEPAGRGQGTAGELLKALIDWARKTHHLIQPDCSYVERKMGADESTHDLLPS